MITTEEKSTSEISYELSDRLANLGPSERQRCVRDFLESIADLTQGSIEEEVYLRALRAMRVK